MDGLMSLFHCDICNDTGYIVKKTGTGIDIIAEECGCMNKRRSIRSLRESELEELVSLYTFRSYQTPDDHTTGIKALAAKYCKAAPAWFYISGRPGSGKTHICTAICGRFIAEGRRVFYMRWTDKANAIKSAKAMKNPPPEYLNELEFLKTVPVLYIDDFLKGKASQADINLAFEILNARYNQPSKRTVISSERSLREIISIDQATGSRIYQRAKGYIMTAPARNWRLDS